MQKLKKFLKEELSFQYNETPELDIIQFENDIMINANFENTIIRINRTYKLQNSTLQVFLGLPQCDISFENLEEMFKLIFISYKGFNNAKIGKITSKKSAKESKCSDKADLRGQGIVRIIKSQGAGTN